MMGIEFLQELRKRNIKKDVIFVTGTGSEKVAVEAMKEGARDYLVKGDICPTRKP